MADSLRDVLGPGGALSRVLPAYEPRAPQLAMAARVEDALAHGRALLVEAGTGTGKTLAYLLPAARSGLKVVVSTATKTLQEQLAEKDVPLLQSLGVDARFAFLKGRQNYLCLLRFDQFLRNPTFAVRDEAPLLEGIARWAETTRTGDRAELTGLPDNLASWRDLSATAEQCTGTKCAHYDRCFVFRMRREAADADVVVVNHHLFFADLALRSSSAGDAGAAVLPRYDAVVFDEAHAVEDVATEHFGAQLSSFRVSELARDASRALAGRPQLLEAAGLAARLSHSGRDYFEAALETAPESGRAKERESRWALLPGALRPAETERGVLAELVRALGAALSSSADEELSLLERRCLSLYADLELFADGQRAPRPHPLGRGARRAPLPACVAHRRRQHPPGQALRPRRPGGLHQRDAGGGRRARLLRPARGPRRRHRAALSAGRGGAGVALRLRVARRALPAAERCPTPRMPPLPTPSPASCARSCRSPAGARSCSSPRCATCGRCTRCSSGELPWQVLLQGEAPKAELLKRFRESPSVLFASQSFWEGVDVPGEALSLVVIDKLPFASPGEPIVAARIDRLRAAGEDAFYGYQVPQAALALKQGFGRLIRTATDRGIVAVLDARVTRKSYGRLFVESLPRCRILRTPEEAARFWRGAAGP